MLGKRRNLKKLENMDKVKKEVVKTKEAKVGLTKIDTSLKPYLFSSR